MNVAWAILLSRLSSLLILPDGSTLIVITPSVKSLFSWSNPRVKSIRSPGLRAFCPVEWNICIGNVGRTALNVQLSEVFEPAFVTENRIAPLSLILIDAAAVNVSCVSMVPTSIIRTTRSTRPLVSETV